MKHAAIISAILNEPGECQQRFNSVVSDYSGVIRGRLGVPMEHGHTALVSLAVVADEGTIGELAQRMTGISGVSVHTSIAKDSVSAE